MKIRLGFVSNSSSSSFLVAFKPQSKQQYTPHWNNLLVALGMKDSPFGCLVSGILDKVWDEGHEFTSYKDWLEHRREWCQEMPEKEAAEYRVFEDGPPVNVKELLENGWVVKQGEIESCEHLSDFHHVTVNYQDENLIFKHQGGH